MYRLLIFLLTSVGLFAQSASLTGIVTDSSGAAVPGARVVATVIATGVESATETNQEGLYRLPALTPGIYSIQVNVQGFKPVIQKDLQLAVQQVARLDFKLEVGAVTDSVEVTDQGVLLDSETSTLGQVVSGKQILELPLLGRNPYALANLVPGVRGSAGMNDLPVDQISTASASINGARGNQNEYLLDGAPNTAPAQNQPVIFANVDSVQEFKVETNGFSAEYGRSAGGVFNVVTKGGTNDLHFSAYEFLRNNALNANDWFANRAGRDKAPFRFNQFGGTIGAPIVKNKTFFFGSAELVRFAQGITYTGTVPTADQLAGNFSTTRASNGQVIAIYDPSTLTANPSGGFLRSPFPNNSIPSNRIDPVARAIAKYWPAANTTGNPITGVNNFVRTDANQIVKNTWSARVDHHFNERNRIFGRFSYDQTPLNRAPAYGQELIAAAPTAGPQVFTRYNAVVEDKHVWSPTLLQTVRASYSRLSNFRRPYGDGFDITTLGLPASLKQQIGDPASFPAIIIPGYSVTGSIPNTVVGGALGASDLIAFGMDTYSLQAQLNKTFSRHNLKVGADFRLIRFNAQQTADTSTQFNFQPSFTQGPNPSTASATAGLGFATFLLGIPGGSVTPAPALAMQQNYYALFVQDDWRITSKLTLNLGLRWETENPRTDRFNQLANFDGSLQVPGFPYTGALTYVNVNGQSRYQVNPDRNNFAPRVGLAYQLASKTVLRGGAGIFYGTNTGIGGAASNFGTSGFQASTSIVTSLDGFTPIVSLSNPYPNGLVQPTGSSLGALTQLGQSIGFYDRSNLLPYAAQWSFNVQHELPKSIILDVGYAGSRGLKFPDNRQFNQLPDSALQLGDALRQQVANPFYPQIKVGILANPTVARGQLLRPYPQFDAVTAQNSTFASSTYHALQAKVEKRYSKGLTLLAAYTYSKVIDFSTGAFSGEPLGGGAFQNWNNLSPDRAVSSLDQTHRLVLSTVYELPFFRNQKNWKNLTAGGWEVGAIFSALSGSPLGISSATNTTNSLGGGQRPNWNGVSPRLDDATPDRWFDTSVFSPPAAYAFGSTPRTFGGARADSTRQIDLSLHKGIPITEKLKAQFRAEAFNLTNTVRFAPPNVSFGNAQFGTVSAMGNQPRIVQLALKLVF